jgi:hypothetical protein
MTYCGNNRIGHVNLGTRYECFKRGVGIGLHLPYDPSYALGYVPIDTRKIYCGIALRLPRHYHIMGNSTMCLQKGVGVGKSIKARRRRSRSRSRLKSIRKHKLRKNRKKMKKKSRRSR